MDETLEALDKAKYWREKYEALLGEKASLVDCLNQELRESSGFISPEAGLYHDLRPFIRTLVDLNRARKK